MMKKIKIIGTVLILMFSILSFNNLNKEGLITANKQWSWSSETLSNMTLEEKVGQFFMIAAYPDQGEAHLNRIEQFVKNQKIGGIVLYHGTKDNLKSTAERFQNTTKTPLFIGMDAELGTGSQTFDGDRFPFAYTIGAANTPALTEKIGAMMAQECRELGVHINFSPVADVYSHPNNIVPNYRCYGENPKHVASHVGALVKGMEANGVMTCLKQFPGTGNTDKVLPNEIPIVKRSLTILEAIDWYPFREGIHFGASSVMVGHIDVPALDNSHTPSSLSTKVIQGYLKNQLNYNGLIFSDALNSENIIHKYGETEAVVKAFKAGCDILLLPSNLNDAISSIVSKVNTGEISIAEIDQRCLKILESKNKFILKKNEVRTFTTGEIDWAKKEIYEKAFVTLKNNNILPIQNMNQKIAVISIGAHTKAFNNGLDRFGKMDHYHAYTGYEAIARYFDILQDYDLIITSIHSNNINPFNDYGMPLGWKDWIELLPVSKNKIGIIFGNPSALSNVPRINTDALIIGYENHSLTQERASQLIMGALPSVGKLPIKINNTYPRNHGEEIAWAGKLKYSQPEELGIDPKDLLEVDRIVKRSIEAKAFPGCQIVAAKDGKIFFSKSYGHKNYEDSIAVKQTDVYDIASITKIAASTAGIMKLESEQKFSISHQLKDYLPELTEGNSFGNVRLSDMLSHQAGLPAWIPFYTKTIKNGNWKEGIYSNVQKPGYTNQVADSMWILNSYTDTIYNRILSQRIGRRKYKYSDLGYYFLKKIIEQETQQKMDDYLMNSFYLPMGLQNLRYKPLNYFTIDRIIQTENDMLFRKQIIHGHVHDPGAAMMGGVGGHAGLFSNATDLAGIMQLFLNKGMYGGHRFINQDVIENYTSCQFCPDNRRALGFDKPKIDGGGTCCSLASPTSFGHSGFTGTLVWADPVNNLNFVFLSNRVYPDAENWKIVKMNIRTEIQKVFYTALADKEIE